MEMLTKQLKQMRVAAAEALAPIVSQTPAAASAAKVTATAGAMNIYEQL